MAADTLASQSIINLDATTSPFLVAANTTGVGAPGAVRESSDYVSNTALGLQDTTSKYKMVRLPLYAKVKSIELSADARPDTGTALTVNVGAYWSDSAFDGTPANLQGTAICTTAFASAVAFNASFRKVDVSTAWSVANQNLPLWQALGLSANAITGAPPAGFIDVVLAVQAAATTGVATKIGARVTHVA